MNPIKRHLDKNNLHHAYLIEGARDEIMPEILAFLESSGIKTSGNPDFCHISMDNFKIEDALNLRSMGSEKAFASGLSAQAGKKIFVVCANNFSLDAQGVLLKMFEEPTQNTHFFVIVPEVDALLRTLVSRFYLIKLKSNLDNKENEAKRFIAMPLRDRIDFLKELLAVPEGEDDEEAGNIPQDSAKSKALIFLNALEIALHNKMPKMPFDASFFDQIFKVREFLRQPGSSAKSLMESVALTIPNF